MEILQGIQSCSLEHSWKEEWEAISWEWIKLSNLFSFERTEDADFWKKYKVLKMIGLLKDLVGEQ